MLRAILVCATAMGCFGLAALAQPSADKKTEVVKGKDDGKSKTKDSAKAKTPLENSGLPKDAIIVVVDNIRDATSLIPEGGVISYKLYQELKDRLEALERQAKSNKKVPFSCKLIGKLEGDFLVMSASYVFSTELPKTTVFLGLKDVLLLDLGDLDGQMPILENPKDEGWVAIVEKESKKHHLTLNFRVPVQVKKSSAGTIERGIELGLPGTPITLLTLELPGSVKELRCNEILEKTKTPGQWQIGLGDKSPTLNLAWKEPLSLPGNAPLPKVKTQIQAVVNEKDVQITAELSLEDPRLRTKDWQLLLPAQATIEDVAGPGGLTSTLNKPDEKTPYYLLQTSNFTAEPWKVKVTMQVPRPNSNARIKIGPFLVVGAFHQQATIAVEMKPEASLGQRLIYTRADGVYPLKNTEAEALFQYVVPEKNLKALQAMKAPLELEWRFEKNQVETQVSHEVKLRTATQGWEIETTTRIQMKTLFPAIKAIDLKLPLPRPGGVSVLGTVAPGLAFPGSVPWAGMWKPDGSPWTLDGHPDEYVVLDELNTPLKPMPQDSAGKTRVFLERSLGSKPAMLIVKNKIRVPAASRHLRLELPQPLNTQDRSAKVSIQADEGIEVLHGPDGAEEPVPDRHQFVLPFDQAPAFVDLAWRPYHREIVARTTLDITLHEHTAQVKQVLQFPRGQPGGEAKNAPITLKLPRGIDKMPELSGGRIIEYKPARQTMLVSPDVDADLVLHYDLALTPTRLLHVAPIGPASVSQMDVKVRVWSALGLKATLTGDQRHAWKERSIEIVPDKEQFPALVLHGFGSNLLLSLKIDEAAAPALAAFLADRALIQVSQRGGGAQEVRARYLIRKIHATHVDIELPLPMSRFSDRPTFEISGKLTEAIPTDKTERIVRLKLHPDLVALPAVLDIKYTIPAHALERTSYWRTTLHAPAFVSEVMITQMRWQFTSLTPMIAASLGRDVRPELRWGWQSWLRTPEPSHTSAELESWLTEEPSQSSTAVTYSFSHISLQPETVYHLPRPWWLLGCSGCLLIVTLGGYFSPLPRWAYWLLMLVAALAALTFGILCPGFLPALLFGSQPGAVLFLVFVGVHWLMQERYRRQLVFLPGFSRAKPGSTMVRTNSAKRPRDASTVDAAPAPAAEASGSAS